MRSVIFGSPTPSARTAGNIYRLIRNPLLTGPACQAGGTSAAWSSETVRSGCLGGNNGEGFFETIFLCTFDLTTHMYETIYTTYEGSGPGARTRHAIWYDAANDDVYMVGGGGYGHNYCDFWRLHMASTNWVQLPDLPLTEEASLQNGTLCGCNGKVYAIGTSEYPLAEWLSDVSWVYYNNEWISCPFADPLRARSYTRGFVVGTDLMLCLGAVNDTDPETGAQIMVSGVEVLRDICEWIPTGTSALATSRLYACNDHLPTGTAEFKQILQSGGTLIGCPLLCSMIVWSSLKAKRLLRLSGAGA